jgi:molecular chaperone GrpE
MSEKECSHCQEEPSVLEETNALETELAEYKDKYIRLLAEMENTRKRLFKEKTESTRFAIENVITEFLPTIDSFENALKFAENMTGEVKTWAAGFQMFLAQFKETLHNNGIVAFHSEGNQFDPHNHEAVETVETKDFPEGTILKEFSKGYKSSARTIRPARVQVAKKPEESAEEKNHS